MTLPVSRHAAMAPASENVLAMSTETSELGQALSVSGDHVDLKSIPHFPGFSHKRGFNKKQHHRPQTFGIVNGLRVEHKEGVTYEKPKMVRAPKVPDPWRTGSLSESTTRETHAHEAHAARATQELPAWDALDRHVLRFFGQFKEATHESNLENHRIRNVVVLYYLEDDTCQLNEPKQDNSGVPQGTLLRRHRVPGPNGGYLTPMDIMVGAHLQCYGRVIRLNDCDDFTWSYYKELGVEQMRAESHQEDAFAASQRAMRRTKAAAPRTSERNYREVELGGGHVNKDMQQFLEWDRKVCRFYCIQDDIQTPQFERRPFLILFFLADDTVEIREQYPLNSGRDGFPRFLSRQPLPKGSVEVRGPLMPALHKEDHVQINELYVGQTVTLGGYTFYIYNADGFTREYFSKELSIELAAALDVSLPERAVPRAQTPPYTGYGSWDDSMASVTHLVPKAPKKDFDKFYHNDKKILRFSARNAKPKPEDEGRIFVISYDLADDTLSIHEPPQRNLGIVTGKFLEKSVHMNQVTGRLFSPDDLQIGAVIKLHNREFEIMDMDDYTRKYRDGTGGAKFDLQGVLEKLREGMRQQFPLIRDVFRKFDADRDGVITFGEFKKALEKWGFLLNDEDALMIMRHFDSREDGQISYNEFCDALLDEDYTQDMMKTKPGMRPEPPHEYAQAAQEKLDERAENRAVLDSVRQIGDVLYKHTQRFKQIFKEFAHLTHERTVTAEQVQAALMQVGHAFDIDTVVRCIAFVLPEVDLKEINYVEFLKAVNATYHDVCKVR